MRKFGHLLSLALCSVATSQEPAVFEPQGVGEERQITACELMLKVQEFRGQIVSIRGLYKVSRESTYIGVYDNCTARFITKGYVWPRGIDLKGVQFYRSEVGEFPFIKTDEDRKSIAQLALTYDNLKEGERIMATFVGLLRAEQEYVVGRRPDGTLASGSGFGHMNAWPAQLILKAVKDIVVFRGQEKFPQ